MAGRRKKKLWFGSAAVVVVAIAGGLLSHQRQLEGQAATRRPDQAGRAVPIQVASTVSGNVDIVIDSLGTVTARNAVTVRSQVDGQLLRVDFREGQMVKAGDRLAEIDPRPFQAQLDQASGQLARDEALLTNAQLDVGRYKSLLSKDSIASQQVDAQEALVRQYQGVTQTDRAQVANAQLQLGYSMIVAPISGRLGLRLVDQGNIVHANDAGGLVVVTETQPITAVFAIPSDRLPAVLAQLHAGKTLAVEALDRESAGTLATGRVLTVDNQIDVTTGTVKVKAEFANSDGSLFPNQFVNVKLRVETRRGVTLLPNAAVQRGTQGTFVYVVKPDRTVDLRPVTLGPSSGDSIAVQQGLTVGAEVVVDGADKLRQGARVEVQGPNAPAQAQAGLKDPAQPQRSTNDGGL
jgi:multidrug efflux system membrane fusion protein